MKFLVACVLLASLAGSLVSAGPSSWKPSHALVDTLKGYLRDSGLIDERAASLTRRRRQGSVCSNNSDCYPYGVLAVPTGLIVCVLPGGLCLCNDCFEEASNGTCIEVECEDWRYDQQQLECDDDRPKQLTAFLLSFFLSSTGAANFYIGRDDLGGGQLFLFILMFAASYMICYLPCCMACCMDKENVKSSVVFIVLMIIIVTLVVLSMLATSVWWLADLIIFATNQRDAANGCLLQENL